LAKKSIRILCVAYSAGTFSQLHSVLRNSHYSVLTAATPSQAVAICVAQFVSAAIVDAESLRGKEWPVVKSLKMVRPSLPIILLDERRTERELVLPEGISDVLSVSSMSKLGEKINQILVRNNFVTTAWNSV
jgi:DNA-binding response OmpR family regulator